MPRLMAMEYSILWATLRCTMKASFRAGRRGLAGLFSMAGNGSIMGLSVGAGQMAKGRFLIGSISLNSMGNGNSQCPTKAN